MKLETVEKTLHTAYPKAFRDIYEAGALRWLCGRPQAKSHLFPNQLLEQEYYPYWNLLKFSEVESIWKTLCLRIELDRGHWKEGVQPVPFAVEDEGDIYFFDAALEDPTAPVFVWTKDCGEVGLVNHNFEHFICSHLCEPVLNHGLPANHWWVQNQMCWLTSEHQSALTFGDQNVIENLLFQTNCWKNTDYVSYKR